MVIEVEAVLTSNCPNDLEIHFVSAIWLEQHYAVGRRPDAEADVLTFAPLDGNRSRNRLRFRDIKEPLPDFGTLKNHFPMERAPTEKEISPHSAPISSRSSEWPRRSC